MPHHHVRYASSYLVPGVSLPNGPSFHRIALHWDRSHPEAEGSCHMDPNTCGLDEFGEPTICTKMAIAPLEMKLTLVQHKGRHHAYAVECRAPASADYAAMPLRLVTIAHGSDLECRLLVLKSDQSIDRIIDLHHEART
jgi:hypothetical protein